MRRINHYDIFFKINQSHLTIVDIWWNMYEIYHIINMGIPIMTMEESLINNMLSIVIFHISFNSLQWLRQVIGDRLRCRRLRRWGAWLLTANRSFFWHRTPGKTWAKHDTMHKIQSKYNQQQRKLYRQKHGIGWCDFGHDQICGPFWYPFWGTPSLLLDWWVYHSIARPGGVILGAHGLHVIHRAIEASCALSAMLLGCRTWKIISV